MPAYSFSRLEFVSLILKGKKPHTIRPKRAHRTEVGDLLVLYYKQRTADCRAICLTVCKAVRPIRIHPWEEFVNLNGKALSIQKTAELAWRDGFPHMHAFFEFFKGYKELVLRFELIEWDTERMLNLWEVDDFQVMLREMKSPAERLAWLDASVEIGKALDKPGPVDWQINANWANFTKVDFGGNNGEH